MLLLSDFETQDIDMTDRTDAIYRALNERGERGITDPIALAALNSMVWQSMRRQWDAWVLQVGPELASELWRHHFGDAEVPK